MDTRYWAFDVGLEGGADLRHGTAMATFTPDPPLVWRVEQDFFCQHWSGAEGVA